MSNLEVLSGIQELLEKLTNLKEMNMTALATYTCGVACFPWKGEFVAPATAGEGDFADLEHLLEIRIFDEGGELHALRGALGREFSGRYLTDKDIKPENYLDEVHFLDIDEARTEAEREAGFATPEGTWHYRAIGGGAYFLPVENAERIVIRNYLEYGPDNIARAVDFRIVKILKKDEKFNGR